MTAVYTNLLTFLLGLCLYHLIPVEVPEKPRIYMTVMLCIIIVLIKMVYDAGIVL